MNYHDEYDDEESGKGSIVAESQLEGIDNLVERVADETKQLAKKLVGQLDYLQARHKLLRQLQTLEPHAADSFGKPMSSKQLQQRVDLLTACQNVSPDLAELSTDKLKERIAAVETINRLEPDANNRTSFKSLRERAKLLRVVEENTEAEAQAEAA
jgi:hypothetical protein